MCVHLRAKEADTIPAALSAPDLNRARGEVHIFDPQSKGLADARPAVGQQRDQPPIAAPFEGVRAQD